MRHAKALRHSTETIVKLHETVSKINMQPLAVFMAVLLVAVTAVRFSQPKQAKHVLVVDCGSSGTRIYAYTWEALAAPTQLPKLMMVHPSAAEAFVPRKLSVGMYNRVETQPGVDAYVGDATGLRQKALGPLLDWASAVVPRSERDAVPLFLFATAGVRRLPPWDQELLMANICKLLTGSGFRFDPSWAKVISGEDEGIYGWVSLNYGQALLQPGGGNATADATKRTMGALDLGGSSLEVTYARSPEEQVQPDADNRTIALAGTSYQLHTHIYKGFGLGDAFERSMQLLLEDLEAPPVHPAQASSPPARPASPPHAPPPPVRPTRPAVSASGSRANSTITDSVPLPTSSNITFTVTMRDEGQQVLGSHRGTTGSGEAVLRGEARAADSHSGTAVSQSTQAIAIDPPSQQQTAGTVLDELAAVIVQRMSNVPKGTIPQAGADPVTLKHSGASGLEQDTLPAADAEPGAGHEAQAGSTLVASDLIKDAKRAVTANHVVLRLSGARGGAHSVLPPPGSRPTAGARQQESAASSLAHRPAGEPASGAAAFAGGRVQAGARRGSTAGIQAASRGSGVGSTAGERAAGGARVAAGVDRPAGSSGGSEAGPERIVSMGNVEGLERPSSTGAVGAVAGGQPAGAPPQGLPLLPVHNAGAMHRSGLSQASSQGAGQARQHKAAGAASGGAGSGAGAAPHRRRWGSSDIRRRRRVLHGGGLALVSNRGLQEDSSNSGSSGSKGGSATRAAVGRLPGHWAQDRTGAGTGQPTAPNHAVLPAGMFVHRNRAAAAHATPSSGDAGHGAAGRGMDDGGKQAVWTSSSRTGHQATRQLQSTLPHAASEVSTDDFVVVTVPRKVPVLQHPCLHIGYNATHTVQGTAAGLGMLQPPQLVQLRGTADWHECRRLVSRVVNLEAQCAQPPCALSSRPLEGHYMALTGFYVVWAFFKLAPADSPAAVLHAAQSFCHMPWSKVQRDMGHHYNVEKYCLWGPYVVTLLAQGLQLHDEQVAIGGGELGWPLGAALAEASKLPDMLHPRQTNYLGSVLTPWDQEASTLPPAARWGLLLMLLSTFAWWLHAPQRLPKPLLPAYKGDSTR